MSVQEIQQLPRHEKLRLMELLWEELSREEAVFDSPAWHGDELKETSQRRSEGREEVQDWETAKARLRQPPA